MVPAGWDSMTNLVTDLKLKRCRGGPGEMELDIDNVEDEYPGFPCCKRLPGLCYKAAMQIACRPEGVK